MSQKVQTPEAAQTKGGRISVLATVGLFLFLGAILAYAYPHFLPGAPEVAVQRFLEAHQGQTWGYVEDVLIAPTQLKVQYVRAADRCKLVGFEAADESIKRLRWARGHTGDEETLKMYEYYATGNGSQTLRVRVDYALMQHGGDWFIRLDSILGPGGIEGYLRARGVATTQP